MYTHDKYLAYKCQSPKRIPHWEHWSNPDAETYLTGIDYYDHPRLCRLKLQELYPQLELPIFDTDDPRPRPKIDGTTESSFTDEHGHHYVRWGDTITRDWDFGHKFKTADDVLAYSPLADPELAGWLNDEKHFSDARREYPAEWGDSAPTDRVVSRGFYNTMFMWPLLTFGWELFLETCMDPAFERIMDEFAEINRHIFRVYAELPINFMICHDDIVNTRGLVCSPRWMHKYIYPRYEEFWAFFKARNIDVIFQTDGNADPIIDDVIACGACGLISEPYTDYKAIARRHKDCFLAGEGDNRVLMRNDPDEIKAMVLSMVDTAKLTGGYVMSIGNHIPWNVPPQAVKCYLDLANELAIR